MFTLSPHRPSRKFLFILLQLQLPPVALITDEFNVLLKETRISSWRGPPGNRRWSRGHTPTEHLHPIHPPIYCLATRKLLICIFRWLKKRFNFLQAPMAWIVKIIYILRVIRSGNNDLISIQTSE